MNGSRKKLIELVFEELIPDAVVLSLHLRIDRLFVLLEFLQPNILPSIQLIEVKLNLFWEVLPVIFI